MKSPTTHFFFIESIFQAILEVILNISSYQLQKILNFYIIREFKVQLAFKWTISRSIPDPPPHPPEYPGQLFPAAGSSQPFGGLASLYEQAHCQLHVVI